MSDTTSRPPIAWAALLVPTLAVAALHLVVNAFDTYGIFRDEFYYLACARRLAWGYVDQPPASIALLAAQVKLFGDGLFSLRLLPSVLAAVVVALTGLTARELGGGRWGQGLSALLTASVPCFLGLCGYYSMNSIDLAVWAMVTFLLARIANRSEGRLWIALGLVLGFGLLNKVSVLYLGVGLGAALVLTPLRRHLMTPWPWLTAAIAAGMLAPHLMWQSANDWPTLEFVRNATEFKNLRLSPVDFLLAVMAETSPLFAPLWLLAVLFAFTSRHLQRHRWIGWLPVVVIAVLIASGSAKAYYADPAFVPLAAAVGVACERWLRWTGLRIAVALYVLAGGLLAAPFAIPLLPVERFIGYSVALGVTPRQAEHSALAALPQFYADRFGWIELAEGVAGAYRSLSEDERPLAHVFGQNYGQAASLEYHRRRFELPPVLSGHNSYYLWGPERLSREVLIVVGDERERLLELFEEVELSSIKRCSHCMPYENNLPIWICRRLKMTPQELWLEVKRFI